MSRSYQPTMCLNERGSFIKEEMKLEKGRRKKNREKKTSDIGFSRMCNPPKWKKEN